MWLIFKFILSVVVLIYASNLLINSVGNLSRYLKVSLFSAAVVFVAITTTVPELFIGINSALQQAPSISLGTVLGTNIANIAFIIGIALIVFKEINLSDSISRESSWWLLIVGLMPLFLLIDSELSRVDGIFLLLIFASYIYYLLFFRRKIKEVFKETSKKHFIRDFLFFLIGILLLVFSADYAVKYGEELAISIGLPLIVLGISLYAFSTSLPELVFVIGSIKKDSQELAFGDLVGAIIANSTLVLGVTAIINPIVLETRKEFFLAGIFLVLLISFIFFVVRKRVALNRLTGVVLIIVYLGFLALEVV